MELLLNYYDIVFLGIFILPARIDSLNLPSKEDMMERRFKIIHWLTVIALITLVVMQGHWLANQYIYTLKQYEEELFRKTVDVVIQDMELRKHSPHKDLYTITSWKMEVERGHPTTSNLDVNWSLYAYVIDKNKVTAIDSLSMQQIDSLCATVGHGIKKYRFDIKAPHGEYDVHDALERFKVNKLNPFCTEQFDSLLQSNGLKALHINTEMTDSIIWKPEKVGYTSVWKPVMEVTYPIDVLAKEQVRVTYELGLSPILGRMLGTLMGSIILSILLISCIVYQTKTIFKQRRIEELRKDFIKTMIHELKRPVSTLKLCISFMKNDKLMQDRQMKDDIIHSSQNELDNLSSYFSKLRDLTYGDLEEIPLNLQTFNLKELVEDCIDKQNLPVDRKVNINAYFDDGNSEMFADKMHISNIFCNLLENAIKYSEGETTIRIKCDSMDDKYRIEVEDDGFGIPLAECKYVFDKYFRSTSIAAKNIPGIGLGLCYVKLLVSAHKGTISLESIWGSGSKFIIEIPKKQ